jgi:3-hydroxyacyl-[acyl-carrier-protein] dehydratase
MTTTETRAPDQADSAELASADINQILELLPHRYPMLMIDRLEDIKRGVSATGIKNVTINEPFFPGHFPGHPIMPGVLIIEAMAQTAAALVKFSLGTPRDDELVYFMSIDKVRFRKPVGPGDTLRIPVRLIRSRGPVWKFSGEAFVGGDLCAESEFAAMIVSPSQQAQAQES